MPKSSILNKQYSISVVFADLIWKAPELLRNLNRDPKGSQKGDVYSFALILYEMYGRKGPFGDCQCDNRGEF